jgi:single-strand DNA-binding protein
MSKSLNRCTFLGNTGRDPEIRVTGSGAVVANFSVAVSDRYKDAAGAWQDRAEWVNLTAFGRLAEVVRDYVKKGTRLYVEGRLKTETWEKNGQKHYKTGVVVENLILLDKADGSQPVVRQVRDAPESEIDDSDIPF